MYAAFLLKINELKQRRNQGHFGFLPMSDVVEGLFEVEKSCAAVHSNPAKLLVKISKSYP